MENMGAAQMGALCLGLLSLLGRAEAQQTCDGGDGSDMWAGDGMCDVPSVCAVGTDCADCAGTANDCGAATAGCADTDNGLMGRYSYTCASIGDNLDKCTGCEWSAQTDTRRAQQRL